MSRDPYYLDGAMQSSSDNYFMVPNPAVSSCRLVLKHPADISVAIILRDVNGRIWKRTSIPAGASSVQIDLTDVPAGIYFYNDDQGSIKGKLVIAK